MKNISRLVFVVLALFSTALFAQDKEEQKDDLIRMCLKGTTEHQVNHISVKCMGKMADTCLEKDKKSTTASMVDCIREEGLVWNSVLNENYLTLKSQISKENFEELRNYQRDWIKLLQSKCLLTNKLYEGSISQIYVASCSRNELARRAIELHVLIKELSPK